MYSTSSCVYGEACNRLQVYQVIITLYNAGKRMNMKSECYPNMPLDKSKHDTWQS